MTFLQITAKTREEATEEALRRLNLPAEALELEWSQEEEAELLAGARPMVELTVTVRLEYVAEKVRACLEGLLEKMGFESEIAMLLEDGMVRADIECREAEILIGMHGETLSALQQLVVRMTRLSGREMPLVLIDAGDYRLRRLERLRRVVEELSSLVVETGEEEYFDPMDAVDRKIVHTLLKNREGVKSYSLGEGFDRHVVVAPEA